MRAQCAPPLLPLPLPLPLISRVTRRERAVFTKARVAKIYNMDDQMVNAPAKEITCEECRDLLSEYVDREISDSERASVEYHIKTCTRCSTESTRVTGLKKIAQHWEGVKGS